MKSMHGLNKDEVFTAEELEKALRAAGFSEVKADHHPDKPWISVVARK